MNKIILFTKWHDEKICCSCPPENKCNKGHGCEAMTFFYDPYNDINEAMKHNSYKRNSHGAITQR